MRLSNLADYAVVMLAAAARSDGARLSATCLAEQTGVPLPTAQKLVGRLAAAGVILSSRGSGGGFRLARDPSAISLADIVEAMEGPIGMTECSVAQGHCDRQSQCGVSESWRSVSGAVGGVLRAMTLAQMLAARPTASAKDATRVAQANA